ncbi:amidohydrolase [Peptoniphilaceae bacterium SGI.131]
MKVYGNLILVTMNEDFDIINPGFIKIEYDKITDMGPMSLCPGNYEDMEGKILIPGFINGHTHLSLVFLRSMADDMADRLTKFLFPMESQYFTKDTVKIGGAYGAYESLLSGTTTVLDMYYYSKDLAEVYKSIGIRAYVGQTIVNDHALSKDLDERYLREFIESYREDKLIQPILAPHAPYSVSEDDLKLIQKLSEEYQVFKMMHIAEMDFEMEKYKPKTPFEYLNNIGLIDDKLLAVHAIHTSPIDLDLLKNAGAKIVSCPGANMKAGKGIVDLKSFMDKKIEVFLGTDGPVSGNGLDLIGPMKLTAYAQKTKYHDRELLPAKNLLELVTSKAAKALGRDDIGSLKIGNQADLVFIERDSLNMNPIYDLYATIVYGMQASNVYRTMVAGKILVDKKEVVDKKSFISTMEKFNKEYMRFLNIYRDKMLFQG